MILVSSVYEAKVSAKSCLNFNINCLTFLKIEQQHCFASFRFSAFWKCRDRTFALQNQEFLGKRFKATKTVAALIKIIGTIWKNQLVK